MLASTKTLAVRALSLGVACAALAFAPAASAQEERDTPAFRANRGLNIGLGPVILFPTDSGPAGGGLLVDGRYGIPLGPTILGPGGRLSGYLLSQRFIGTAMPTLRITLPAGPFAPYVLGGLGGGWVSNPSEGGAALMGGGGLMIHFGRIVAVGAELTYQTITGTEYRSLAVGPAITFGG